MKRRNGGRFWFSPDMGNFEAKDGKFYFETGAVHPNDIILRMMPSDHGIKYSEKSKKWRRKQLKKYK